MTKKQQQQQPKQEEVKQNGVDLVWDGWFNNVQTFHVLQNEVEEKSIQLLEKQKEAIVAARETFSKLEAQSEKMTAEWKQNLGKTTPTEVQPNISGYLTAVEDIGEKVQSFVWNPTRTAFDFFTQSQEQLTANYKELLEIQRQGRKEAVESIETFAEQMKQSHKSLLASIQS